MCCQLYQKLGMRVALLGLLPCVVVPLHLPTACLELATAVL